MKPILFNTEMVRAILDGRKTQTRRVIKGADPDWHLEWLGDDAAVTKVDRYGNEYPKPVPGLWATFEALDHAVEYPMFKAPYEPADILYVRETWDEWTGGYVYKADGSLSSYPLNFVDKWRPSIHMPKEAARLFLRVTEVRAERLQESFFCHGATVHNLAAEGVDIGDQCRECIETYGSPCCIDEESECGVLDDVRDDFARLWDSTIKPADRYRYGWATNPWVWVIEFERCERPEDGDGDG